MRKRIGLLLLAAVFVFGMFAACQPAQTAFSVSFIKNTPFGVAGSPSNMPESHERIQKGALVPKPSKTPSLENYVFGGWYKEGECNNVWDFEADTVQGRTLIYAKWTHVSELKCTVTFNANLGMAGETVANLYYVGNMPAQIKDLDAGSTLSAPPRTPFLYLRSDPTAAPVLDIVDFAGWYTDAACQNAFTFDGDIVTENLNLYAKWVLFTTPPEPSKFGEKKAEVLSLLRGEDSVLYAFGAENETVFTDLYYIATGNADFDDTQNAFSIDAVRIVFEELYGYCDALTEEWETEIDYLLSTLRVDGELYTALGAYLQALEAYVAQVNTLDYEDAEFLNDFEEIGEGALGIALGEADAGLSEVLLDMLEALGIEIPEPTLEEMIELAGDLLEGDNSILYAFGATNAAGYANLYYFTSGDDALDALIEGLESADELAVFYGAVADALTGLTESSKEEVAVLCVSLMEDGALYELTERYLAAIESYMLLLNSQEFPEENVEIFLDALYQDPVYIAFVQERGDFFGAWVTMLDSLGIDFGGGVDE